MLDKGTKQMNKTELVKAIAETTEENQATVKKVLEAFIDQVGTSITEGDDVVLIGFGTFTVNERAARTGRNPRTGEEIQIAACKNPAFKAGKALKELVNQ